MTIGCIGAGSWGTTLSIYLARLGHSVRLWAHSPERREEIRSRRENATYLPGATLPDSITLVDTVAETLDAPFTLIATPTQFIRETLSSVNSFADLRPVYVNTSKGIEIGTILRISEVIADVTGAPPEKIVTLSGPSHAEEVSHSDPAALVAGCLAVETAIAVQDLFNSSTLRVYATDDIVGVEIGGALKNVIAICTGIVDGLDYGDNTKAALITRGLAEITRLGIAMGARQETFSGLSGLGDLIVTCTSRHSRNRYVGEQIGRGRSLKEITEEMSMVAEGVSTTRSAWALAQAHGVEMPLLNQVHAVLFEGKPTKRAILDLMERSTKLEHW